MDIEIVINGKKYTLAEAEELHRELDKIFGGRSYPLAPLPTYPQYPLSPSSPHVPYWEWSRDYA